MFSSSLIRTTVCHFGEWLCRVFNQIDDQCPNVFHFIPESYLENPFEIFRSFKRGGYSFYETEQEEREMREVFPDYRKEHSLPVTLASFLSRHFSDPSIPKPDFKETYLTRLNFFMQFQRYIDILEHN